MIHLRYRILEKLLSTLAKSFLNLGRDCTLEDTRDLPCVISTVDVFQCYILFIMRHKENQECLAFGLLRTALVLVGVGSMCIDLRTTICRRGCIVIHKKYGAVRTVLILLLAILPAVLLFG